MSRMRTLLTVALLGGTGLLAPATAASAGTPLRVSIVCDAATGTITTAASGGLLWAGPPKPVTVEFQRRTGRNVTPTGWEFINPLAEPFRVTVMSTSTGEVSATGYTGSFNPATSLYYRETVRVTFSSPTGDHYGAREATCERDLRTTVTLTCDPTAGTVTAAVVGRNGRAGNADGYGRPTRVGYQATKTSQETPQDPGFTSHPLDSFDAVHRITQATDGTWTDTGYVRTITGKPYYYAEEVTVSVWDRFGGGLIGGGSAKCILFNGSGTPAR